MSEIKSLLKENIYEHAKQSGLKYLYISGIDNILNRVADPFFIGQVNQSQVDLSFKFVQKAYPSENVGLHVLNSDHTFGVMGFLKRVHQHDARGKEFEGCKWGFTVQSVSHFDASSYH